MSMITATTWVPRGCAAAFPTRYDIDEQELSRISRLAKLQLDDAKEGLKKARNGSSKDYSVQTSETENEGGKVLNSHLGDNDELKEYDLENYDSDVAVNQKGNADNIFGNVQALAYYGSNDDDPYITLHEDENDDEEREELQILATDNMVVAARVEDEVAHLEIYVYEDQADNLYVHHDIMLPAIPLCVEWLDLPVGKPDVDANSKGNLVAVGTFEPDIEVWDIDTVDCMFPNAILGQGGEASRMPVNSTTKKKRTRSKKVNDQYHVDAVLSLSANKHHRNLLASSSADKTIKLWDLNTTVCAKSYSYHTDKVCTIAWHPKETTVLLSGSYDHTIVAADMRAPDAKVPRWAVESDVETVRWDPSDPNFFYVTTENGAIHYHDVRSPPKTPEASNPVWILQAHDQSISSFDINPIVPGFLVTGSTDKEVKLWNVQPSGPSMVASRNLGVGKVFSTTFGPDPEVGFRLAVAGSKGTVQIWDTSTNLAVRNAFATRMASVDDDVPERTVGVVDESTDSESEEGPGPDGDMSAPQCNSDSMEEG